jgi:hypothetical protein
MLLAFWACFAGLMILLGRAPFKGFQPIIFPLTIIAFLAVTIRSLMTREIDEGHLLFAGVITAVVVIATLFNFRTQHRAARLREELLAEHDRDQAGT